MPPTAPLHDGAIAVFAKCPIPGSSKTRLSSLVGSDGSAQLAKAMLSDVLMSISQDSRLSSFTKVLVYAPSDKNGQEMMQNILSGLGLPSVVTESRLVPDSLDGNATDKDRSEALNKVVNGWHLMPMMSPTPDKQGDLNSSDLGSKLADALGRVRKIIPTRSSEESDAPVAFLGMDTPEIPVGELADAMDVAKIEQKAYMNPCYDGGYGMLLLPSRAPASVFEGVRWSCSVTAVSQLKALSDHGIGCIIGSLMRDIDEVEDVMDLAERLCKIHCESDKSRKRLKTNEASADRLLFRSQVLPNPSSCSNDQTNGSKTFVTLIELGLVAETDEGYQPTRNSQISNL